MSNNIKAFKSGIWYVVGNVITKCIGLISTPIFARIMTKNEIGGFSNFAAWIEILSIIVTLNLSSSIMIAKFDFKDEFEEYISSILVLGSIISLGFYSIIILFKDFFLHFFSFSEYELYIAFVYMLVFPAFQMFLTKSRIDYKYKSTVLITLLSTIISTSLAVFCVFFFEDKLFGRIIGNYLPLIAIYLVLYWVIIYKPKKISTKYWKYGIMISLPMMWHSLSGSLLGSSDRIMITSFCGKEENALYSIAYYCGMMITVFWSAINNAWAPWAYEKMNEKDYKTLKKMSKLLIAGIGFLVFLLLLIAPEMLLVLGGVMYLDALDVVPPVLVANSIIVIYSLYVNIEYYLKKQILIAIGTSVAAMLNIFLNFIFIPVFGYIVASYTTLVSYLILCLIHYHFVKKLGKNSWYDTKFNVLFVIANLLLIPIMMEIYKHTMIRRSIIGILFLLGISFFFVVRKEMLVLFKEKNIEPLMQKINFIKR